MRVYVGQSQGAPTIARLRRYGFGECVVPSEYPPRRTPWFFDCGAFRLWRAGKQWESRSFLRVLWRVRRRESSPPDFIVLPDIVGGGLLSLARSLRWICRIRRVLPSVPLFLAVQDGMTAVDVAPLLRELDGLFVGGTLKWKIATGDMWATLARTHGVACHIGRCGGIYRVKWARRIGATSIDSSLPLFSVENLMRFVNALNCKQMELLP